MATLQTFHKILDIHERDKKAAQKQYQQSVETFEQIATKLYETLKKKENAEAFLEQKLRIGSLPAQYIAHYRDFLNRLDLEVKTLQPKVQQARSDMTWQHSLLSEAHIEVKKYENLIDRKVKRWEEQQRLEENKEMDALSIRQFSAQGNR
ncbi:flagellar export protein FliJ [Thalassobacillus pellis]|uniref:flagellar export protein FliJ n=1 Tax=Thalassobacillus pellis TaxID=748008 RepID=UPI001961A8BC|nr:flagellar FliJ protein [Thalassobacillus pellis]